MPESETGFKWWVKNAIMPLLTIVLGGGGLVAILNFYRPQSAQSKTPSDQNQSSLSSAQAPTPAKNPNVGETEHPKVQQVIEKSKTGPSSSVPAAPTVDSNIVAECGTQDYTMGHPIQLTGPISVGHYLTLHWNVVNAPVTWPLYFYSHDDKGAVHKQLVEPKGIFNLETLAGADYFDRLVAQEPNKHERIVCTWDYTVVDVKD